MVERDFLVTMAPVEIRRMLIIRLALFLTLFLVVHAFVTGPLHLVRLCTAAHNIVEGRI